MKKKVFTNVVSALLAVLMLFSMISVAEVSAAVAKPGYLEPDENPNGIRPLDDDEPLPSREDQGFTLLSSGTYKLIYDNVSSAILPDSYKGIPVTAIGDNAYMGRDITWAIIPDTVTAIGDYAFADCEQLTEVIIPSSVTSIGEGAFDGCPNLRLKVASGSTAQDYAVNHQIPYTVPSISDFRINSVIYNAEEADVYFFDSQGSRVNLKKDVDYTMEYTFDADKSEVTLVIRGKGKYTGEYVEKQQITGSFPIGNQTIELSDDVYTYDGSAKTPSVTVYYECPVPVPIADDREPSQFDDEDFSDLNSGDSAPSQGESVRHTLVKDRDYTVSYRNNVNIGLAEAIITGKGFYTGSTTIPFTITGQSIEGALLSLSSSTTTYDGSPKMPAVTVRAAGRTLTQNVDFTVSYQNNINAGTATVTVTGTGNYGGTITGSFVINKRSLSGATAVLSGDTFTYDGSAKRPEMTLYINGRALTENTDYTVSYENDTAVGTGTVTAAGVGNYQGTVSRNYVIQQEIRALADCTVTLSQSTYTYDGSAKKPTVTVKYGSTTLAADTDYTVSYSGNVNAGKASVTLTGKGNYVGTKTAEFTIKPKSLTTAMVNGESTGYTFSAKQLTYRCTVTDGGKTLSEGTDYTVACSDNYHAGKATAIITGKGNYTSSVTRNFTISPFSIENAAFGISYTSCEYDGTAKRPQVNLVYKSGFGLTKEGKEFTVSYQNNVLPGTATVTVTGIGDYSGSSSKTFTITTKAADQFVIELAEYSYTYDGADKKPKATVKCGNTTLTEGTHYTVSYSNCRNAGTATATVTGKGAYSGTKSVSYTISPLHISWATASLSPWTYTYDGTAKKPALTLEYKGSTLRSGTDYTYSYEDNIAPGTGTVNYYGKGNWYGSCFEEFEIKKLISEFEWGADNWSFNNSSKYFTNGYYVDPAIKKLFVNDFNLSNTAAEELDNNDSWGGSCSGMTAIEMLVKYGYLDITKYGLNPVVNKNSYENIKTTSLINCFQNLQSNDEFLTAVRREAYFTSSERTNQSNILKKLEEHLRSGDRYAYISFSLKDTFLADSNGYKKGDIKYGGHAVLGYKIENCYHKDKYTGLTYNKRVLLADPNDLMKDGVSEDDDFCLYYQSDYSRWTMSAYNYSTSIGQRTAYWNSGDAFMKSPDQDKRIFGRQGIVGANGSLKNIYDYNGRYCLDSIIDNTPADRYISGVSVNASNNEEAAVEQITDYSNTSICYAGADDNTGVARYQIDSITTDIEGNESESYALWNPTASYTVSYQDNTAIDLKADYKDVNYYADFDNANYVIFSPEGYIGSRGSSTDYNLTMVTNEDECVTDWYKITVSGSGVDEVGLTKTNDGYVLKASDLSDVTIQADNSGVHAETAISTTAKAIYIYEIDENTIGVLADVDGNGDYETDLIGDSAAILGDVDGDRTVTVIDATMIQRRLSSIPTKTFIEAVADTDGDNSVTIIDATYIQRWLAGLPSNDKIGKPIR